MQLDKFESLIQAIRPYCRRKGGLWVLTCGTMNYRDAVPVDQFLERNMASMRVAAYTSLAAPKRLGFLAMSDDFGDLDPRAFGLKRVGHPQPGESGAHGLWNDETNNILVRIGPYSAEVIARLQLP